MMTHAYERQYAAAEWVTGADVEMALPAADSDWPACACELDPVRAAERLVALAYAMQLLDSVSQSQALCESEASCPQDLVG